MERDGVSKRAEETGRKRGKVGEKEGGGVGGKGFGMGKHPVKR